MTPSDYFPRTTCKIRCGKQGTQGNGFLVSKNQIVTAAHTLTACLDNSSVKIVAVFHEYSECLEEYEVQLVSDLLKGSPLALLQLPKDFDCDVNPLCADELTEDNFVKLYGYLGESEDYAEHFNFRVSRVLNSSSREEYCNTILTPCDERVKSFGGLSGSALIYDDKIVGMLLRQKSDSTVAIRAEAVTGLKFRKLLLEEGIELSVAQLRLSDTRAESGERITSIPDSVLTNEIDSLMSKQFEPIRQQRVNGQLIDSWTHLQEFIKQLPNSGSSLEKKAEFYYSGALWALSDGNFEISEEYILQAKRENPHIDDRTYRAKKLMNEENFAKAREILQPLNSIATFNLHLACFLADNGNIPQVGNVLSELKSNNLMPDSQTHRLVAIIALDNKDYIIAHEHIGKAKSLTPNNPELKVYEALILYWEAMHPVFKYKPRSGFACYTVKRFYPTNEQREQLTKAYSLLEEAYSETQSDIYLRAQIVWGLLLVSALLPGKDPMRWLSYVDEIEILLPSAIIFRIDWDIKIPDELYQKFVSNKVPEENVGIYTYALMEIHIAFGEYDKARKVFEVYGDGISKEQGRSRDECNLRLLLDCKEYALASELLRNLSLSENDKKRYELIILLYSNPKGIKLLIRRALALAKKTHEILDYLNADTICRKFKKWKEAAENAQNWFKDTNLIYALECQATALLENGYYPQALRVIKMVEDSGDCSERLKLCKLNCLVAASRFEDAIKLAKSLGDARSNPKLVIFQAQIYINNGQKDKAVQILRAFADDERFDFELYNLLVELIKPENPDMAYQYAYQLHLHEPENKEILKFTGMIGLQTGHSELATQFFSLFHDGMPEEEGMRFMTIKEVQEMLHDAQKSFDENAKLFMQSKIPIHCLADLLENKNMGGMLCSQWETIMPVRARYGSKDYVDFNCKKPVILDYTACITILELDIFDSVLEMFDSVWITNNLLAVWLQDANGLRDVQHHVVNQEIKLSDELNRLPLTVQPRFTGEFDEYNKLDIIHMCCAKENNAFIIAASPAGEILEQPVPDEWYNFQIYPDELYTALEILKMPYPPYDAEKVRSGIVKDLLNKPRIVIDNTELAELLEANALELCFSHFLVFMTEEIVSSIHFKAQEHRDQKKWAEWLENGYTVVGNLIAQNKVRICPIPQQRLPSMPQSSIYSNMLKDEFLIAKERGDNIWCDDRLFSRYNKVDGAAQDCGLFIGTLDVLKKMREHQILSENEYYQKIDKLLASNYCFFVPDANYLFSRIIIARCDNSGRLIENKQLTYVRRAFALALHSEFGLNVIALKDTEYPEIAGYLLATSHTYRKCMEHIWRASENEQWKSAASDWLLLTIGDFFGGYSKETPNYVNQWTLRLYLLATSSIHFDEKYAPQYSEWLNSYINTALINNSALIDDVASHIADLLANAGKGETKPAGIEPDIWKKLNLIVVTRLLEKLPDRLLERVVAQPTMRQFNIELEGKLVIAHQCCQSVEVDEMSFRFEDILCCDEDAMENVILLISSSPQEIGKRILNELSDDRLGNAKPEMRYRLARFFFDLSWYLPCELCYQALEKKRYVALISNQ